MSKHRTPAPAPLQTREPKQPFGSSGRARLVQSEGNQESSGVHQPTGKQSKAQHLRTPEAAEFLGVSASFLNHKRLTGDGPPYRKFAAKVVVYDIDDLLEWARNNSRTSTSGSHNE